MARRGDWVPCLSYGTPFTVEIDLGGDNLTQNIVLVAPRDQATSQQGEVGTVEVNDSVRTDRVVGQILLVKSTGGERVTLIERIRVGLFDDQGAAAFYADDFSDASEANEPFLWQRVSQLEAVGDSNMEVPLGANPWWSALDVRVSRRLDRTQALFYSIQAFGGDGNAVSVTPFLRTFAR